ncbi:MAG: hypothetical protein L6R35_005815 [Caloplaca aegaea]|nr:MAG: hypothetical protein L6R35_005815 [Caloplaca aegaea]
MTSAGACIGPSDFATIIPQGQEAEDALDLVYDHKGLSDHHRSFLRVERLPRPRDSDSETGEVNRHNRQASHETQYWAGCYALSLQDPIHDKTSIGWKLGKGASGPLADKAYGDDQGVDLLLIRPGDRGSRQTAPVHARICFHARSGVLMIFGVEKDRPVLYQTHDARAPLSLAQGESHVLYQATNSFSVGRLHYNLVFTELGSEQYTAFVEKRNAVLFPHDAIVPHPAISAVPRAQDVKRGNAITHGIFGFGGFGRVFAAVEACTGEPLAVKQHLPTNKYQLNAITLEARVGASFKVIDGLHTTLSYWCEHDYDHACNIAPQAVFTSSPLAIWDFSQVPWIRCSIYRCLKIFRGPLQGLVYLHAKGYMHRDVTLKNMFFLSENPDRAVLGDFGKAVRAKTDMDASIGPAASRAPEVDGKSPYSNKIDVWSMGWALLWAVAYDCIRGFWENLPQNFDTWYRRVVEILTITKEKGSGTSWLARVAELLIGMLTLDPATRISAAQALTQLAFLLASPPPEEASPQPQSPKLSSSVSDLSERDARVETGGLSTSFEKQVQPVDPSGKKARLG